MVSENIQAVEAPGLLRLLLLGKNSAGTCRRASMVLSCLATFAIGLFFIRMHAWKPPEGLEAEYSTHVHWALLIYLFLQTVLIQTSVAANRGEVWFDTLTTFMPLALITYVLVEHWRHYTGLPLEQLRYAKSTWLVMFLDFSADFVSAVRTERRAGLVDGV
jgi:hypothetical protein